MTNTKKKFSEISLYVHVPFCQRKCFFCSFVISVGNDCRIDRYLNALDQEMTHYRKPRVSTVYIGGGTPSYLSADQIHRLVDSLRENFIFHDQAEFTIEINPENIDSKKVSILYQLGINRISLGIQTFQDPYLRFLGRSHTSQQARDAFDLLKDGGFQNISVDLMYGFPNQVRSEIEDDLRKLISLGSDHISLYALAVEKRSRFFVKNISLPKPYIQKDYYELVRKRITQAGYRHYEISNFAKPNKESRHNIIYWKGGFYIGVGVGAHSHIDGRRYWNPDRLYPYIQSIEEKGLALDGEEILRPHQRLIEELLFGLRMSEGVNLKKLQEKYRASLTKEKEDMLSFFIKEGLLIQRGDVLKTSVRGRLILDELCTRLI